MSDVATIKKASFLLYRELMDIVRECEEPKDMTKHSSSELDYYSVVYNFEEFLEAGEILQQENPDFEMLREYMLMTVDLLEIIREGKWAEEPTKKIYEKILAYFEKKTGGEVSAFINVYEVERRYGGPEEGGWYYNHYNCIDTKEVPFSKIDETIESLKKEYGTGEGDIYSVLGGYEIQILVEEEPAKSVTKERPYYC
jgi:hypothetical protein